MDAHLTTFIPQIEGIHNYWSVNLGLVIDSTPRGISKPHRFAFSEISSRTPSKKCTVNKNIKGSVNLDFFRIFRWLTISLSVSVSVSLFTISEAESSAWLAGLISLYLRSNSRFFLLAVFIS